MIEVCGTCKNYSKRRCPVRFWLDLDDIEDACLKWEQKYDEVLMVALRYKYGVLRKCDYDYKRLPY
jgi:hypothetical protein